MTYYPNRTMCDILEAMRKCHQTRNYSYLSGLIEEAQNLANRMEAGLYDKRDLTRARDDLHDVKVELSELKTEVKGLEAQKKFLDQAIKKGIEQHEARINESD